MQVGKFLGILVSILSVLLLCNCTKKTRSLNTTQSAQKDVDSISYWLSKKNAPDITSYQDRLKKALIAVERESNDSIKIKYTSKLSLAFSKFNDYKFFERANGMALNVATRLPDSTKIAEAHWDAGTFFKKIGVIDSSYYHHFKAHKIFDAKHDKFLSARMLLNMSDNLQTIKDFATAETYAIQSVEILKSMKLDVETDSLPVDYSERLFNAFNTLGINSNNLKDYGKALDYYQQAKEYLNEIPNNDILWARYVHNIGAVYRDSGDYKTAVEQFFETIKIDSLYEKKAKLYATALNNYAHTSLKLGDTADVEKNIKRAIAIHDSLQENKHLSRDLFCLSEYYLHIADTLSAYEQVQNAKNVAQSSDNNLRVLESLNLLAQINPKKASTYFDEYKRLDDSLQVVERRSRNKFERIRFETNETLAENALLARQKQLWTGIAGAVLLLGLATYIIIIQRLKNEKLRYQKEQQKTNQRIFDLLLAEKSKIEEGKQLAQKRISEELHDAVQGKLQGIRMLLLGLNKRNTPEAVIERGEAITELKNVQEEVRSISHELSHAAYQKIYSFISTIQELLNEVKKTAGLQNKFMYDENIDWDSLNSDIKINVYRIIQESIQNCVKYAEAKLVELTLELENDEMLHVIIADNGKGFHLKNKKKGIGMRNINSRVEKLGGTWEIQSEIGHGTKVILYIPILNHENLSATADMKIA